MNESYSHTSPASGEASAPEELNLDTRRRRLRFRAWHRGMREMDMVMGPFADAVLEELDAADIADFEVLIDLPDPELFSWFTEGVAPAPYDTPLFRRMKAFHTHHSPVNL